MMMMALRESVPPQSQGAWKSQPRPIHPAVGCMWSSSLLSSWGRSMSQSCSRSCGRQHDCQDIMYVCLPACLPACLIIVCLHLNCLFPAVSVTADLDSMIATTTAAAVATATAASARLGSAVDRSRRSLLPSPSPRSLALHRRNRAPRIMANATETSDGAGPLASVPGVASKVVLGGAMGVAKRTSGERWVERWFRWIDALMDILLPLSLPRFLRKPRASPFSRRCFASAIPRSRWTFTPA